MENEKTMLTPRGEHTLDLRTLPCKNISLALQGLNLVGYSSPTHLYIMRRVSSRQRLVSWDAFDATVIDSDEEQDYVSCYEASLSRQSSFALDESLLDPSIRGAVPISPVSRKRDRGFSEPCGMHKSVSFSTLQAPAVIAALTCELEGPRKGTKLLDSLIEKPSIQFEDLIDDVKLHMFSFLSVPEARTMSTVNKHYRHLLHSPAAVSLWTDWIRRRWPSLSHAKNFVDLLQTPTAVCNSSGINFSVLLGHAARHQPTGVDKSLLIPPPVRRLRSFREESIPRTIFRTLDGSVQYTGPVGTGDRCIRGDQPLAGPDRMGLWSSLANKVRKGCFLKYCTIAQNSLTLLVFISHRCWISCAAEHGPSLDLFPRAVPLSHPTLQRQKFT